MTKNRLFWWLAFAGLMPLPAQAGLPATTLFRFSSTNGSFPVGLIQGSDQSFFGTTLSGGPDITFGGYGTIFQMTTNGTVRMLFAFDGTNGYHPIGVLPTGDGCLYGTTSVGGDQRRGNVYRLASDGTFTSLFSFNGTNGSEPGMLVQANDGALYGTTAWGGIGYTGAANSGYGTLFKITTNGSFTSLVLFTGTNGSYPYGFPLVQGSDGSLYGTTVTGGALFDPNNQNSPGEGTIFKVSPQGALNSLCSFFETNGSGPLCLAFGNNGDLYGTTQAGGSQHLGTAFWFSMNSTLSVLHHFTGGSDGRNPWANIVRGRNGNFFGTAGQGGLGAGTVFELTTSGTLTTLYSFTGGSDGGTPFWLMQGEDALLYTTTQNGSTIVRLAATVGPALATLPQVSLTELTSLTVTNTATDSDLAATTLSYTLLNPPVGAQIDSNGVIAWTPTLFQSPSTNLITTIALDDGIPPLRATNSFTVIVSGPYDGIALTNPIEATADLDGDGVPNLVEFALGTDPRRSSDIGNGVIISTIVDSGSRYLSMKFKRRRGNTGIGLLYFPEVSADTQTWSSDSANVLQIDATPLDAQFDWITVRDQTPTTAAGPRFIRLRVTEN